MSVWDKILPNRFARNQKKEETTEQNKQVNSFQPLSQDFWRTGRVKALENIFNDREHTEKDLFSGYLFAALDLRKTVFSEFCEENIVTRVHNEHSLQDKHLYLSLIENSTKSTEFDFWNDIMSDWDMKGEFYLFLLRRVVYKKEKDKDGNYVLEHLGKPISIEVLDANQVNPLKRNGKVVGYEQWVDSTHRRVFAPEQIIHVMNKNPFQKDQAYSIFDIAKDYQYTMNRSSDFTKAAIVNNTNTPGILSTDQVLNDQEYDNLVAQINGHEAGKLIFSDGSGKLNYTAISQELDKSALPDVTDVNRQIIFAITGTSKTMLGIEESGTTRDTSMVQSEKFLQRVIRPMAKRVIAALNFDYRVRYPELYKSDPVDLIIKGTVDAESAKETYETQKYLYDSVTEMTYAGYTADSSERFLKGDIDYIDLEKEEQDPEDFFSDNYTPTGPEGSDTPEEPTNNEPEVEENAIEKTAYSEKKKIKDFLYELNYDELDYEYAKQKLDASQDVNVGACSSVQKGNFYGRKYDWLYDNTAEFIVRTPAKDGRYATIGVGGFSADLTEEVVSSDTPSESYKIVPFKIVDGINEKGLVCNINVVPVQKGETTGTTPLLEERERICNLMLPRYILDNFATAKEATEYIKNYVSVYNHKLLGEQFHYDLHVMVGDKDNTYVIEFVNNEVRVLEKAYMTNFHLSDVNFNSDGSVYTPETKNENPAYDAMSVNNITSHGSGLERYNLINEAYETLESKEDMAALLDKLTYTNAYKDEVTPRWYTEGVGEQKDGTDETVNSSIELCEQTFVKMKEFFAERSRENPMTWQTVHSSLYDIEARKVYIIAQEDGEEMEFQLGPSDETNINEPAAPSARPLTLADIEERKERIDALEAMATAIEAAEVNLEEHNHHHNEPLEQWIETKLLKNYRNENGMSDFGQLQSSKLKGIYKNLLNDVRKVQLDALKHAKINHNAQISDIRTEKQEQKTTNELYDLFKKAMFQIVPIVSAERKEEDKKLGLTGNVNVLGEKDAKGEIENLAMKCAQSHSSTIYNTVLSTIKKVEKKKNSINLSEEELSQAVKRAYLYNSKNRAGVVSEDVFMRAVNTGRYYTDYLLLEINGKMSIAYKTLENDYPDPCPLCDYMIGQPMRPFKEDFVQWKADLAVKGTDGKVIEYHNNFAPVKAGDLHPGCRCMYSIVLKETEATTE